MNWKAIIAILAAVLVALLCFVVYLNWEKALPPVGEGAPQDTQQKVESQPEDTTPPEDQDTQVTPPVDDKPKDQVFTLSFAGDCTLGDDYSWYGGSNCFLDVVDGRYDYPLKNVLQYFGNDDFTMVNFEGVLSGWLTPVEKAFRFRAPVEYAQVLTEGSVEAVNLANNHIYDYGQAGYESTKKAIDGVGVTYVEEYATAMHTTEKGLVIGLYASQFGMDMDHMRNAVRKLRENGAQIVIIAYHGGIEGGYRPTAEEKYIARGCIDAGADIFFGHHPHVLQPMEHYNGGLIMYSLGNFAFGGNPYPGDYDTAVIQQQVIVSPDGTVRLGDTLRIPCSISSVSYINDYCPTPYGFGTKQHFRVLTKLDGVFNGPDLNVTYEEEEEEEETPETPEEPEVPDTPVTPEVPEPQE